MVDQFGVKEARKVSVQPFITTDEFIDKTEARHESVLLEPKYGAERAQEENAFNRGKCNHLFGKTGIGGVAPLESPVDFALNAWYCFNGMEQVQFLCWILDVSVNEEGVRFAVDVFDCNLEAVEALGFGGSHFGGKIAAKLMMPLAVGKNQGWEMKWRLVLDSLFQSMRSAKRLISSAVQKEASAFLYIRQMLAWCMGKSTKQCGFSCSSGSVVRSPLFLAILCFDNRLGGLGAFLAFLVAQAVLVQNSSQLLPLLRMKLVILQKAWYMTACWRGMVWYKKGVH
jgi:hypothetical protein